jgi:CheY-like chemotaxis protein
MDQANMIWGLLAVAIAAVGGGLWWRAQRQSQARQQAQQQAEAQFLKVAQAEAAAAREAKAASENAARSAAETIAREQAEQAEQAALKRAQAEDQARALAQQQAAEAQAQAEAQAALRAAREAADAAARHAAEEARLTAARAAAEAEAAQAARRELEVRAAAQAREVAQREAERAAAAAPPPGPAPAPRRPEDTLVMVADDSKVVRVKTSRLLTLHGYRVVLAEDGARAAELLETEVPAVLITDVEMPGLDGLQLTRHVRAHPRAAGIPIIMITSADDRLKDAAAEAGVTLVLGKPYPEDELIACIERSQQVPAGH